MLALAAYNLGPTRVRAAVRRVEDPIQQRNFWYLYRSRRLPQETREYVPRISGGDHHRPQPGEIRLRLTVAVLS